MDRQAKILEYLREGKTYDFISKELKVSPKVISKIKKGSGESFPSHKGQKKSINNNTPILSPDIYSAMDTSKNIYQTKIVGERTIAIKESLQYLLSLCQKRSRKHPELNRSNLTHIAVVQDLLNYIDMNELHGEDSNAI